MLNSVCYSWVLRVTHSRIVFLICCLFIFFGGAECASQTFSGTVHNGTTGKMQSGAQIILLQGTLEIGRTQSGKDGQFQIEAKQFDRTSKDVLKFKALHDGVAYDGPAQLGALTTMTVYDGLSPMDSLSDSLSVFQFETPSDNILDVAELHMVHNDSWPPRTNINPDNFNLALPAGAKLKTLTVYDSDGRTTNVPIDSAWQERGTFRPGIPIKPGLTKYAVTYEVPYNEKIAFQRRAVYPMNKILVVVPATLRFSPLESEQFHSVADKSGANVQEMGSIRRNESLRFNLSGTGTFAKKSSRGNFSADSSQSGSVPSATLSGSSNSPHLASNQTLPSEIMNKISRKWFFLALGLFVLAIFALRSFLGASKTV